MMKLWCLKIMAVICFPDGCSDKSLDMNNYIFHRSSLTNKNVPGSRELGI